MVALVAVKIPVVIGYLLIDQPTFSMQLFKVDIQELQQMISNSKNKESLGSDKMNNLVVIKVEIIYQEANFLYIVVFNQPRFDKPKELKNSAAKSYPVTNIGDFNLELKRTSFQQNI